MTDLEPGDDEHITAVARGDYPALLALYDRHGRIAYGLAYRILGDAGAAEEAVRAGRCWLSPPRPRRLEKTPCPQRRVTP